VQPANYTLRCADGTTEIAIVEIYAVN